LRLFQPNIILLALLTIAIPFIGASQFSSSVQVPEELKEISGLEMLGDSLFVAINDGGHDPLIFILGMDGRLIKKVKVKNAENNDWEDLATDGQHLYIGDIGNNNNTRKKLCILKVSIKKVLEQDEVETEHIRFSYANQKKFPPHESQMIYDSEALFFHNDSLWLFSKPNPTPWSGLTHIYKLPVTPGSYTITAKHEINMGNDGWWSDAVTAADIWDNTIYVTTYTRMATFKLTENNPILVDTLKFEGITQKESIVVRNQNSLYIADEKQVLLGGGKIYTITND